MDIAKIRIPRIVWEQGGWVKDIPELGDILLKVRPAGNDDFIRRQAELFRDLPRGERNGTIDPETNRRMTAQLIEETILTDWKNLRQGGEEVPYTLEKARELLHNQEYSVLADGAIWASNEVKQRRLEGVEDIAKN